MSRSKSFDNRSHGLLLTNSTRSMRVRITHHGELLLDKAFDEL